MAINANSQVFNNDVEQCLSQWIPRRVVHARDDGSTKGQGGIKKPEKIPISLQVKIPKEKGRQSKHGKNGRTKEDSNQPSSNLRPALRCRQATIHFFGESQDGEHSSGGNGQEAKIHGNTTEEGRSGHKSGKDEIILFVHMIMGCGRRGYHNFSGMEWSL